MTEHKIKMKLGSELVEGVEVPIEETIERWTELKLGDGAVLRIKLVVGAVMRVDDRQDPGGNPLYAVKSNNVLMVIKGPDSE